MASTPPRSPRTHGLPLDLDAALDLAVLGTVTTQLELARMGDVPFLNAAGTGLSRSSTSARSSPGRRGR